MVRSRRRGMTLLEVILALGLAVLILYSVSMAIDFHLRILDVRRSNVEEAQIARATLQLIANDLRSTVREFKLDMSAVEQSLAASASSALESVGLGSGTPGSGSGGAGNNQGSGGAPSGNGGSGGSGNGGQGNQQGSTGGPGNGSSGNNQGNSGGPSGSGNAGAGSGSIGSGTTAGNTSGSGSSSSTSGSTSQNTQQLASTTQLPPAPGLYGNQYQLQIDVSRLPRPDQYQPMLASNQLSLPEIPSDVKTVTYFVQDGTGATDIRDPFAYGAQVGAAPSVGLVRREVDRSVVLYAQTTGTSQQLQRTGELIAPEITSIQFQYFDGVEWLPEWDSTAMKCLPVAVEILIAVSQPAKLNPTGAQTTTTIGTAPTAPTTPTKEPTLYRLVVHLPLGEPVETESSETTDSGLENVGL